jgi:effector-associated domain 8 (EAD8)-containing protein/NACHT domain-containing protein
MLLSGQMRMLEETDRKRFLNILIRHPFLESDRKRRALLINCGLEHLLSEIETSGAPRDFVHLLYAALTRNLITQPSKDLWLISLLTYLLDFSGPQDLTQEDQEFLTHLIQKLRQKPAERETPPVNIGNTDNVSVSPSPLQTKMAEGSERTSREAEQSYLKYVVKSLEWLEITGLPTGVVAQSAPLEEVFIPLRLRPNRPLTEYPLTERELAEYYRRLKQNLPLRDLERYVFEAEKNWSTRERGSIGMNDFWRSLTKERPAAIIQGYPGVGKSTLLKYLALYMARRCLKQRSRVILAPFTPTLIPFLISLGDFANERTKNSGLSLMEYFQLKLSRLHIPGLSLFLEKSLEAGKCLILLDGLDEISDHRMRIEIQNEIKEFILTYSDLFEESSLFNRFLVTTRVAGYDQAAFPAYPSQSSHLIRSTIFYRVGAELLYDLIPPLLVQHKTNQPALNEKCSGEQKNCKQVFTIDLSYKHW